MTTENLPEEVQTKNALASTQRALEGDWSFTGDAADLLIPRLLIGQAMSECVQKERVGMGKIYRSTSLESVGGKGTPLEVIPLYHNKTWVISEKKPGAARYEFRSIEAFTGENQDLPWDWKEGGSEWKRTKNLNFFVLLPSDIDKDTIARRAVAESGDLPDMDAALLPCFISFQSTSFNVGKKLVTHFANASDFGLPPFVNSFMLDTESEKNDKGTFYVLTVNKGTKTDPSHLPVCKKWYDIVSKQRVKVDEDVPAAEPNMGREYTGPTQF